MAPKGGILKESEFSVNWRVFGGGGTLGDRTSVNTIKIP